MSPSRILGPDGEPLDLNEVRRGLGDPQTAQLGEIVREFEGHPARGLTPARLARIMENAERGDIAEQLDLVDDMEERDAHLFAEVSKRRNAVAALKWSVEAPENASDAEKRLTDQVRDWVGMLTCSADAVHGDVSTLLSAMTSAILPGFAPVELVWQLQRDMTGTQVLVPHCTLQPRRWFTSTPDGRGFLLRSTSEMVPATDQLPGKLGVALKPLAWLMHVHPARNGYLARTGLARVLFWPYLFKHYSVRDLAEFLEIYGIPPRIGRYPAGASDDEKRSLLQAVASLGHNAAGIIPQSMVLDFMAMAQGTHQPFTAMWDRMDAVESKAILGQTLTASEGQHGTQALGKVHNQVRHEIRDADARLIERSFNAQLIRPLCLLNVPGVNPNRLPRLMLDTGKAEDLATYADLLPKLASGGLRIGVDWVHKRLRIPKAQEGAALFGTSPTTSSGRAEGDALPGGSPRSAEPDARLANLPDLTTEYFDRTGGATEREALTSQLIDEAIHAWEPLRSWSGSWAQGADDAP